MGGTERYQEREHMLKLYKHELLAKLYNLRQGNKDVTTYHDEFQKLILKIKYYENTGHVIIQFKVGLKRRLPHI